MSEFSGSHEIDKSMHDALHELGIELSDVSHLEHTGVNGTIWRAQMRTPLSNAGETTLEPVVIKRYPAEPDMVEKQIEDWQVYRDTINNYFDATGIITSDNVAYQHDRDSVYFINRSAGDGDVQDIFSDDTHSQDAKIAIAAQLFESLSAIPANEKHEMAFMIDGKPSNFCLNDDGTFTYVDTYPAHFRDQQTGLIWRGPHDTTNWNNGVYTDTFMHGDIYGIIGRYWGHIRKDHPKLWEDIPYHPLIQETVEAMRPDLRDYTNFLLETDTAFMQTFYRFGENDPEDPRLYDFISPGRPES